MMQKEEMLETLDKCKRVYHDALKSRPKVRSLASLIQLMKNTGVKVDENYKVNRYCRECEAWSGDCDGFKGDIEKARPTIETSGINSDKSSFALDFALSQARKIQYQYVDKWYQNEDGGTGK